MRGNSTSRKISTIELESFPQKIVERAMAATISRPPMVGVLSLEWSTNFSSTTPASLADFGTQNCFSFRIVHGPNRITRNIAVSSAQPERNVTYSNRRSGPNQLRRSASRYNMIFLSCFPHDLNRGKYKLESVFFKKQIRIPGTFSMGKGAEKRRKERVFFYRFSRFFEHFFSSAVFSLHNTTHLTGKEWTYESGRITETSE